MSLRALPKGQESLSIPAGCTRTPRMQILGMEHMNLHEAGYRCLESGALTKKTSGNQPERGEHGSPTPRGTQHCGGAAGGRPWGGRLATAALPWLFRGKERVSQGTGCAQSWALVAKFSARRGCRGWFVIKFSPTTWPPPGHSVARGQAGHGATWLSAASVVAAQVWRTTFTLCGPRARHLAAVGELLGQAWGWTHVTQCHTGTAMSPCPLTPPHSPSGAPDGRPTH